MKIEDIKKLPKMYRVIEVKLDVLRDQIGYNMGVMCDCDTSVTRKVRRVLHSGGWKWQVAIECPKQSEWDYCLESDQECLNELNHELGLVSW